MPGQGLFKQEEPKVKLGALAINKPYDRKAFKATVDEIQADIDRVNSHMKETIDEINAIQNEIAMGKDKADWKPGDVYIRLSVLHDVLGKLSQEKLQYSSELYHYQNIKKFHLLLAEKGGAIEVNFEKLMQSTGIDKTAVTTILKEYKDDEVLLLRTDSFNPPKLHFFFMTVNENLQLELLKLFANKNNVTVGCYQEGMPRNLNAFKAHLFMLHQHGDIKPKHETAAVSVPAAAASAAIAPVAVLPSDAKASNKNAPHLILNETEDASDSNSPNAKSPAVVRKG